MSLSLKTRRQVLSYLASYSVAPIFSSCSEGCLLVVVILNSYRPLLHHSGPTIQRYGDLIILLLRSRR